MAFALSFLTLVSTAAALSAPTATPPPSPVLSVFAAPESMTTAPPRQPWEVLELLRRQDSNCPSGYSGCDGYGVPTACCSTNAICTVDDANDIACCPSGAACTGKIGQTGGSGGGGGGGGGGATGNGVTISAPAGQSTGPAVVTVGAARRGMGRDDGVLGLMAAGAAVGVLGGYVH